MATKVVHLGEQLESTNNRRERGVEAQSLMHHLSEFQVKAKPSMAIFTDPSRVTTCRDLILCAHALTCTVHVVYVCGTVHVCFLTD